MGTVRYHEIMEIIGEYEDRSEAMVNYDMTAGKWIISTYEENIEFDSVEELIWSIKYTIFEWDRERMFSLALQIAQEEQRHNTEMEKLMEEMEILDLDKSEKYEILESARMAL